MSQKKETIEAGAPSSWDRQTEPVVDRLPWAPSPMVWNAGGATSACRQQTDRFINDLIGHGGPEDLADVVRQAVSLNYLSTQARLLQHNFECHAVMMSQADELTDELKEILARAEQGLADQDELLALLINTSLPSLELAKLTHPYGERSEYLKEMQTNVERSIDRHGGFVFDEPKKPSHHLKINNHQHHSDHFIATMKELVGHAGGAMIAKRTAWLVLADPARGFDVTTAARMAAPRRARDGDDWHDKVFMQSGAKRYVEQAMNGPLPDFILPVSTVYYGYRPGVKKDTKTLSKSIMGIAQRAMSIK